MKVCRFCGTENADAAKVCSSCGANEFKHKCGNCGTLFDEGNFCPKCGVKADAKAKKCPNCGAEYYSAACPDCGYANRNTETTVVYANITKQPTKKRKTWLWVLGWIFIFPVPLTILMLRNQKMNKWVRVGIIAIAWIFYFGIAFTGRGSTNDSEIVDNNYQGSVESTQQEMDSSIEKDQETVPSGSDNVTEAQNMPTKESTIEDLVNEFNAVAPDKLEYTEDFVVSSEDSGHYRIEFRLTAYKDAVGKSYKFGDQIVDIISCQSTFGDIDVRIYADGVTLDQCKELIQYASNILDPTMTDATISDTITYIEEHREANGYYYGELGLLLQGSDTKGYDIMIKTD
jgi:ribosomal protein L40E